MRTILSQLDFERALEDKIDELKPLLKQQFLIEDQQLEIEIKPEEIA